MDKLAQEELGARPSNFQRMNFYQKYNRAVASMVEEHLYLRANLTGYNVTYGSLNGDGIFVFVNRIPSEHDSIIFNEKLEDLVYRAAEIELTNYRFETELQRCYLTAISKLYNGLQTQDVMGQCRIE